MVFLKVQTFRLQFITSILLVCLVTACQPASAATVKPNLNTPASTLATETPVPTAPATDIPTLAPDPTSKPLTLWLPPYLPAQLMESVKLLEGMILAQQESDADLRLDVAAAKDIKNSAVVPWVYALVAPFPTITDEASLADLKTAWSSTPPPGLSIKNLLVDPSTAAVFQKLWGIPSKVVQVLPTEKILDVAWSKAETWAILPFEQLQPRWKVILVDGQSPVQKEFSLASYGLTVYFTLTGDANQVSQVSPELPVSNRLPEHLTTVMLTGVTALVRGTASLMEGQGMTYPARDIGGWLRDADILHISNEVAFAENCPQPFDWEGLAFCSQTEYIKLLEDVGTDVVELTGDHFKDWGTEAMLYTLKLYKERGWKYYGGGANAEDAMQPALFEHNGNRIAFIGCNAKEVGYSTASATSPGAIHCDMDQMVKSVEKLGKDGYQPIVTFQHIEYYSYKANPI
ncbi:MAG: CapA family protein, partial [Anaerolineaceae bacterium]|nr:CapA family protein [Anaerolineaceae bacterium]